MTPITKLSCYYLLICVLNPLITRTVGEGLYQVRDFLSNVRAIIDDKEIAHVGLMTS